MEEQIAGALFFFMITNLPGQCLLQLIVELSVEPFCYSYHLQIQAFHVPLFPMHIPFQLAIIIFDEANQMQIAIHENSNIFRLILILQS